MLINMYDITDEKVEQTEMLPDSMYEYGPESSVDMSEVMRRLYKNHVAMYSACLIIFIGIQVSLK